MKSSFPILQIIKREGNLAPYDRDRISTAIFRAMASLGQVCAADGGLAVAGIYRRKPVRDVSGKGATGS